MDWGKKKVTLQIFTCTGHLKTVVILLFDFLNAEVPEFQGRPMTQESDMS